MLLQQSLLLTFLIQGSPSSIKHHGRWDPGQLGASSRVSPPSPCRAAHHITQRLIAPLLLAGLLQDGDADE